MKTIAELLEIQRKKIDVLKKENIELKLQIEELEEDSEFLTALMSCGVDNWDGFSDAVRMINEKEN